MQHIQEQSRQKNLPGLKLFYGGGFCIFRSLWGKMKPGGKKNERGRKEAAGLGNGRPEAAGDPIRAF